MARSLALFAACWLLGSVALAQKNVYHFAGEVDGDLFGRAVSGLADIDGDGHPEIVVGARSHLGNGRPGQVYVYSGRTGALIYQWSGEAIDDRFGISVTDAGDLDLDGFADVLVGAKLNDEGGLDAGKLYWYSGQTGLLIESVTGTAGEQLGQMVRSIGDVDGDLAPDATCGAVGDGTGHSLVIGGGDVIYDLTGEAADDFFGISVAPGGDLDGDTIPDFLVAAYQADTPLLDAGRVYAYSGADSSELFRIDGTEEGGLLGSGLSGGHDVDGDDVPDLLIGSAFGGPLLQGSAWVYSGATATVLYSYVGELTGQFFGASTAFVEDVNGDGTSDILVGAPTFSFGVDRGWAYLYSGQNGQLLFRFGGESIGDRFGIEVASGGDVNGDGFGEVLVGAYLAGPLDQGSADVFAGNDLYLQVAPTSVAIGQNLTISIRGGPPLAPALLAAVAVNGFPISVNLGFVPLDANGQISLSNTVPNGPGVSGNVVTFQAFSLASGKIIDSGTANLQLQ